MGQAAHPEELRKKLNSRQIAEWAAYFNIEPFGAAHEELCHGIRACLIANQYRDKDSEPAEPKDFMPSWEEPPMTPEEIARSLAEWKGLM